MNLKLSKCAVAVALVFFVAVFGTGTVLAAENEENTTSPWLLDWPDRVTPALAGSGTVADPWLISSEQDFIEAFRYWQSCSYNSTNPYVELRAEKGKNVFFCLTQDITLHPLISNMRFAESESGGRVVNRGTIDGQNHTLFLDGFYRENRIEGRSSSTSRVLFDSNVGTIQNLIVKSTPPAAGLSGSSDKALLADYNGGIIHNCQLYGDLNSTLRGSNTVKLGLLVSENGGTIEDCTVKGSLSSPHKGFFGGICGSNLGRIINCSSFVGLNIDNSNKTNLTSTAYFIQTGGIAGSNAEGAQVSKCKAQVAITVSAKSWRKGYDFPRYRIYLGGVAGNNLGSIAECETSGLIYCEYKATETEAAKIGGIAANVSGVGTVADCKTNIPEQSSGGLSVGDMSAVGQQGSDAAADGKPNCIICGNTGRRKCTMCHGDRSVVSGDYLLNFVGPVECLYCHGEGSVPCVCGR